MKYIIFSFDDGRKDFYTNALEILKKYKHTAVVNVIGNYIGGHAPVGFLSSGNEFMNIEELKIAYEYGIEIGNHSMNHSNELGAIKNFKINDDTINGGGMDLQVLEAEYVKAISLLTELLLMKRRSLIYEADGK